jgi:hypothetical protein
MPGVDSKDREARVVEGVPSMRTDFAGEVFAAQPAPCLSLYQPTHGHHPDNRQDRIRFRKLTRALEESLTRQFPAEDRQALLEPFRAVAEDAAFWRHTRRALALLRAPGFFRIYRLQRPVPERAVVADSFHLKPLLRVTQTADAYHVLALNRREMRLFEGNRDTLEEIALPRGTRTITEALGDLLTEPHLTVASYGGSGGGKRARRHGHGSRKDEIDIDTEQFFRAVDRSIHDKYSRSASLPLILAALPEYHEPFRRVSRNPFLLAEGLQVDPGALSPDDLCTRVWRLVEPRYVARVTHLAERFVAAHAAGRGADDLSTVATAAVAGRVDTLLIDVDRLVPGRIDPDSGRIEYRSLEHPDTDDVLDDLGELVLRMKGNVVVVPAGRMPSQTGVAAIYRF